MSLPSGGGDDAVVRVCERSAPAGGDGMYRTEGTERGRSHRPLTNGGYKSERGPEGKDTP
ncbi:MAG: hypothetical protein KTR25_08300 [Myxococcales bacterium]|nr:hypothetical protein [Myxococcales bacterium]